MIYRSAGEAPLRTVNWLYRSLLMVAFVILAALNPESCDRADSLAIAAFLYQILLTIFMVIAMKKAHSAQADTGKVSPLFWPS